MIRTTLVVAMLAFGATALVAQSDPIAARKALMKANGDQSKVATDMLEAKQPFLLACLGEGREHLFRCVEIEGLLGLQHVRGNLALVPVGLHQRLAASVGIGW